MTFDFTPIDGIGPKTSRALYASGIEDFSQLAALSADEIVEALSDLGVAIRGDVTSWIVQARELIPEEAAPLAERAIHVLDDDLSWDMETESPEFDRAVLFAQSPDGFAVRFSPEDYEKLQALRDTMSRFWGGNKLTVEGMIRRMINNHLGQYGQERLS